MINWVNDSWNEIQLENYTWDFMRPWIQFVTTAGQDNYTWQAIFADPATVNQVTGLALPVGSQLLQWVKKSFRCSVTSIGYGSEQVVNHMPWDDFRNVYLYAQQRVTQNRPVIVAVAPDKSLWFGPVPDTASGPGDSYTISCEVWLAPYALSADTDTPLMPSQFHMAIVYKTMLKYAGYEAAPEVLARGNEELQKMMNALYTDQQPIIHSGPPLATDPR